MIEGSIFSIRLGLPGSGKSIGVVEEDALPHLLDGEEVWSNFWINWNGDNLHYFCAEEFEELAPTLSNCVLLMDEIGQVMEPRAWEQESGNIRRFFQLHRHHHVDIYGTTQDISLVAKTAWIVVDEWIFCYKLGNTIFDRIKDFFKGEKRFRVGYQDMTYQELKKISYGWENSLENEEQGVGGPIRKVAYSPKELIHTELTDRKKELWHYHCLKCAGRQVPMTKEEINDKIKDGLMTENDLNKHICPKHWRFKEEMEIRESGLYDSDYDIEIKEKDIILVPMIDSPKGYRKIAYKGALSLKQLERKTEMEKRIDK